MSIWRYTIQGKTLDFHNPQPLLPLTDPNNPWAWNADSVDFSDAGDRIALAQLGIFSLDRSAKRDQGLDAAYRESRIDYSYRLLGRDRRAEHRAIAATCSPPDGVWARSCGEYTRKCDQLDRLVLREAQEAA